MFRERVREYFSFTRKERMAVLALIFLILVIFILPHFFTPKQGKNDLQSFNQFKNAIASLKTRQEKDSSLAEASPDGEEKKDGSDDDGPIAHRRQDIINTLFYFDPNTISAGDWKKLGLRDRTIHTIQNYIRRGGRFKSAPDLKKIYGLSGADYGRLFSFIRIKTSAHAGNNYLKRDDSASFYHSPEHKKDHPVPVDINEADSAAFITLPGIGSKLAARIIRFREKLGGFYEPAQVAETYGLADSSFQKIKMLLKIANDSVRKIDINKADLNTLQQHPYIRWDMAKAIIQYRNTHGPFKTVDELQQIMSLGAERFRKMVPYLKVN